MLERLHEHINQELNTNTRTDTIFVITGIVFNFIMLGISSAMAGEATNTYDGSSNMTASIVLGITMTLTVIINGIAITGLITGRTTREKLYAGLLKMYTDSKVAQYYDSSLLSNYTNRYALFMGVIGLLGLAAIAIPLVVLFTSR
jgi:hypothetical protein